MLVSELVVADIESAAAVGMSAYIEESERHPLLACQSEYIAGQTAVVAGTMAASHIAELELALIEAFADIVELAVVDPSHKTVIQILIYELIRQCSFKFTLVTQLNFDRLYPTIYR